MNKTINRSITKIYKVIILSLKETQNSKERQSALTRSLMTDLYQLMKFVDLYEFWSLYQNSFDVIFTVGANDINTQNYFSTNTQNNFSTKLKFTYLLKGK